ncbi:MAG: hypothetical protein ACLTAI_08300 [Thomasclavelia sp.]
MLAILRWNWRRSSRNNRRFCCSRCLTSAGYGIGTASTGTAISTLSGVAATNATLAALGGGSLAKRLEEE